MRLLFRVGPFHFPHVWGQDMACKTNMIAVNSYQHTRLEATQTRQVQKVPAQTRQGDQVKCTSTLRMGECYLKSMTNGDKVHAGSHFECQFV